MWFPKKGVMRVTFFAICFILALYSVLELSSSSENNGIKKLAWSKENSTGFVRKLLAASPVLQLSSSSENNGIKKLDLSKENRTGFVRKLLASPEKGGAISRSGTTCSMDNIVILQGFGTPLPSGIPTYTVQVSNVCVTGCSISNIHFRCGWFSSARLINPTVFRRLEFNDCLVNNGDALGAGDTLSFQYANSFPYRLSVSSVTCN